MTEDYINSHNPYEAQFSATIIQTDPIILSDTFDVRIDFAWNSFDLAKR